MSQILKVALTTLGCKLNYSETSTISRQFIEEGYSLVKFEDFSEIYIINSCPLTENAEIQINELFRSKTKTPVILLDWRNKNELLASVCQ